jgi:gluconokinase
MINQRGRFDGKRGNSKLLIAQITALCDSWRAPTTMSSVLDEVVDGVEPAPGILSVMEATRPAFLLSIDVGTSGVRAALFDDAGVETMSNPSKNARRRNEGGLSDLREFDADALIDEVITTIDELFASALVNTGQIEFIAISTFWHSLVGVDDKGSATTPLLSWADTRAAQFANDLRASFDETEIHARTGCRFHASYWPAKLLWIGSEWPDRFAATHQWLGLGEYLCLRLFGGTAASISLASATGLFNQRACDWDWDFIRDLNLSPDTLPQIDDENRPRLNEAFARRWPALATARLAVVVGDGATNNIGAGCSTRDKVALMVGTSGAMRVVFAGDPPDQLPSSLWSYRATRTRVVVGGALSDGGGLFRWLRDSLNIHEDDELESKLAAFEPDSHGLTILPFWSGERSTGWSSDARGVIFGLKQETQPAEIVRAALEAIAYRFALIARDLDPVALHAQFVATGNALRSSPVWIQIIADVLGRPIALGNAAEASIRGAALLALEAVGKIATIEDVSVSPAQVFEPGVFQPDMARHARYREGLARQEELYARLFG